LVSLVQNGLDRCRETFNEDLAVGAGAMHGVFLVTPDRRCSIELNDLNLFPLVGPFTSQINPVAFNQVSDRH